MDSYPEEDSQEHIAQSVGTTLPVLREQPVLSDDSATEEYRQRSASGATSELSCNRDEDSFEDIYKRQGASSIDGEVTGSFEDYSWNDEPRTPERQVSRLSVTCHETAAPSVSQTTNTGVSLEVNRLLFHRKYLSELGQRWVTVEPVVIVSHFVFYSLIPTLRQYVYFRLSRDHNITYPGHANESFHQECLNRGLDGLNSSSPAQHAFHQDVSLWDSVILFSSHIPIVLVLPFIGVWSDALGRRVAMVPQLLSQIICCAVTAISIALELPLWALPVVLFLTGLTGSLAATSVAAYAYLADIQAPEKRLLRFTTLEAGVAFTAMTSELITDRVSELGGYIVTSIILTGILALLFFYVLFFVPETVLRDRDARVIPCFYLSDITQLWVKGGGGVGVLPIIWLCLAIMFCNSVLARSVYLVIDRYLVEAPLCWPDSMRYIYVGVTFVLSALGCVLLVKTLQNHLRWPYFQLIGSVSLFLHNVCLGFAKGYVLPFVGCVLGCVAMTVRPVTRAVASAVVNEKRQGALFAGLGFVQMLANLISFPIVDNLYDGITAFYHRYIFLGLAACMVIPSALIITLIYVGRRHTQQDINIGGRRAADTDDLIIN